MIIKMRILTKILDRTYMIVSLLPLHAKPTGGYFATSHPASDKFYVIFKNEMERFFFYSEAWIVVFIF